MARRTNASIQRFIKLMNDLPAQVAVDVDDQVKAATEEIARQIKQAAPVGETGALRASVKVSKNTKPMSYRITAGGSKTTRGAGTFAGEFRKSFARSRVGKALGTSQSLYDYARAVEYGNARGHKPKPFFFPTFNKSKKAAKRQIAKTARESLKRYFDNA